MTMQRILVTGAGGQIGTELVAALRSRYGDANVVATDIQPLPQHIREAGPTARLDVTQADALAELVRSCNIDTIYHMAAILSATGEEKPRLAWNVNIGGLYNVLEVARELGVRRIYHPSSIAAFGPETPKVDTPQETVLRPTTMYGITKVTGEMLGVLSPALRAGHPRHPLSGRHQQRDAARRRHDRLRGRNLLRGHPPPPLHLLRAGRHGAADDLHARLHPCDLDADGGGRRRSSAGQCM